MNYEPIVRVEPPLAYGESLTFPNGTHVECIYDTTMRLYRITQPDGIMAGIVGSQVVEILSRRTPATYYDLYAADGLTYVQPYRRASNALWHIMANAELQRQIAAEDTARALREIWRQMHVARETAYRARRAAAPYMGPDIDCERMVGGGFQWHCSVRDEFLEN